MSTYNSMQCQYVEGPLKISVAEGLPSVNIWKWMNEMNEAAFTLYRITIDPLQRCSCLLVFITYRYKTSSLWYRVYILRGYIGSANCASAFQSIGNPAALCSSDSWHRDMDLIMNQHGWSATLLCRIKSDPVQVYKCTSVNTTWV